MWTSSTAFATSVSLILKVISAVAVSAQVKVIEGVGGDKEVTGDK